jgi:hypothetical protein
MDPAEDRRIMALTPHVTPHVENLLRTVAGLEPEEEVPAQALVVTDRVLGEYGTDGLRVIILHLTVWATLGIELMARQTGVTTEAVIDRASLSWRERFDGMRGE